MWLSDSDFRDVIAHTPLVSLDFIVTNAQGDWLLGQRRNRPAQGFWFVPGGRVRKNESFDKAAYRLTFSELGHAHALTAMRFLGPYEHFYPDSMLDAEVPTHYVVLAYQLKLSLALADLPTEQHAHYCWWSPEAIATSEAVHANTRAYLPAVLETRTPS